MNKSLDVELVIFDCDGMLVDSETISSEVLAQALSAEGLPTTTTQARRDYQGLLLAEIISRAQERLGHQLPKDWLAQYERDREEAFRRELKPVLGAAELVEEIIRSGVAICVASQGKLDKTRLSLELTGLDSLFPSNTLFSAYSVPRGKPYPDLFLAAASTMGVKPSRCVVLEDSPSGIRAAREAGMRVFGFLASGDEATLRASGAELLRSLDELPVRLGLA